MTHLAVTGHRLFLLDPEQVPDLVHGVGARLVQIFPDGEAPGEDIITAAANRAVETMGMGERPPAWMDDRTPTDASPLPKRGAA